MFTISIQNFPVRSGSDGSYTIAASEGDRIMFSRIGFRPDTATVIYSMLLALHEVTLYKEIITLKNVTVTSSYQMDSLARRNYYNDIYARQPGITGLNRPLRWIWCISKSIKLFLLSGKAKKAIKKTFTQTRRRELC